jgi:hypothetical protein
VNGFSRIDFEKLTPENQMKFFTWFRGFAEKCGVVTGTDAKLVDYVRCLNVAREKNEKLDSARVEVLREAHHERQRCIESLIGYVSECCRSRDRLEQTAALEIREVLSPYGEVRLAGLPEALEWFETLLKRLNSAKYRGWIEILGLEELLDSIKNCNERFENIKNGGDYEDKQELSNEEKQARLELREAYYALVEKIERINSRESAKFKEFVGGLRARILLYEEGVC